MRTISVILFVFLQMNSHAQEKNAISGGLGANGVGLKYVYQGKPKVAWGGWVSFMYARPSVNGSFFNKKEDRLVKLYANFPEAAIFLRWFPWVKEDLYSGITGNKTYLTAGLALRPSQWMSTQTIYKNRRRKNPITDEVYYQQGTIDMDVKTSPVEPFLGIGRQFLKEGNRFTLHTELGLYLHGKPKGTPKPTGTIELIEIDYTRANTFLKNFIGSPLAQIHAGYRF